MSRAQWVFAGIVGATVVQLAIGTFAGIDRFEGKGYGYRLVLNPVMMCAAPIAWALVARRRRVDSPVPWTAANLVASSFLFDALGNTLDLYDSVEPWDNISHAVTWFLLTGGIGLMLARGDVRPRWALGLLIIGVGAAAAIVWEAGEYVTFIRQGTELDGAYEDTLSDELLGTAGSLLAALLVLARVRIADRDSTARVR
jgi:hypothetical protein